MIEITRGGVVHDFNDIDGLKSRILEYFELYRSGSLTGNAAGIEKFTRRSLAGDYAKVLGEVASESGEIKTTKK